MKIKVIGHSADFLKRKAKSLSKSSRITHTEALNMIAKEHGYESWEHLICNQENPIKAVVKARRPKVPEPAVRNYYDHRTGKILGQHPNTKMTPRRHAMVGEYLQDLLNAVEYHKRAKSVIQDIRITMDGWLGNEYSEAELANVEFNQTYYGKRRILPEGKPSLRQQAELKRQLRHAKAIIDRSYYDCKPLEKLYQKFELAAKALDRWPKTIKAPGLSRFNRRVPAGTFVRIDHNKKIGLVFRHDTFRQVVEGYTDAGKFLVGRHEITVLRTQSSINNFKPMRLYLPYGKWKCADNSEVLFNRDYCPIWQRTPDGEVSSIAPDVRISYNESEFYYDDRTAPYYDGNNDTFEKCLAVLKDWEVAERLPKLFELMPAALQSGNLRMLSPKGIS